DRVDQQISCIASCRRAWSSMSRTATYCWHFGRKCHQGLKAVRHQRAVAVAGKLTGIAADRTQRGEQMPRRILARTTGRGTQLDKLALHDAAGHVEAATNSNEVVYPLAPHMRARPIDHDETESAAVAPRR